MKKVLAVGCIFLFVFGTFIGVVTVISGNASANHPFCGNIRVDDDTTGSHQEHPAIDIDSNGNIYVVWEDWRISGGEIFFAKSTNYGARFSSSVRVGESGAALFPALAVAQNGNIYVSWEDYRNNKWDIYFANSTDGGGSFGRNVRVNDNATAKCRSSAVAVDNHGNVYVVWYDNRNGNSLKQDIYFAKSANGGFSFGTNIRVNDDASGGKYFPKIAVVPNGNIYVVWQDDRNKVSGGPANFDTYFAKSENGGASFDVNHRVNDDSTTEGQWNPSIAVDDDGIIYVVWVDNRNGAKDIYFAKSVDNGTSFSPNRRVNAIQTGTTGRWSPDIAVDTSGHIHVVWLEERNGVRDIYYSESIDGGQTFGQNLRVNDVSGSTPYGVPSIGADSSGNVYVVWEDNRNGNYDIYFATTNPAVPEFSTIIISVIAPIATLIVIRKIKNNSRKGTF